LTNSFKELKINDTIAFSYFYPSIFYGQTNSGSIPPDTRNLTPDT
jgi:hypothetical protein